MKSHKLVTYIGIVIAAIFIVFGSIMYFTLRGNMKEINNMEISDVDFTQYTDGIYEGIYYYEEEIGATLNITIESGVITSIEIVEHLYGLGGEAENILDDVITAQSLQVDTISGATSSSIILLKAIENAFIEGGN